MLTFEKIKNDKAINEYIRRADQSLNALGYTEHNFAHVGRVSNDVEYILRTMGYSEREIEIGKIAAYMHDIGNLVNRVDHSQSGAVMAFRLLDKMGMDEGEIATIVTAIGNHDEGTGVAVNPIAAALIIADKSDVRRARVRNNDLTTFDIHDRVNYSVSSSSLEINEDKSVILLKLTVETQYSSVMEYFEIFLDRMTMCRHAARYLGLEFKISVNGQMLL